MRQINTLNDARIAIREIFDTLDALKTRNIDLQLRRVVNAGPSEKDNDYVIRKELYDIKLGNDQTDLQGKIAAIQRDLAALEKRVKLLEKQVECLERREAKVWADDGILGLVWETLQDLSDAIAGMPDGPVVEIPDKPEKPTCEDLGVA